jgi:cyanophycin synthetase
VVADGLRSFRPREGNPGRGILLRRGDVHLLVDYAHNPAAICAMADTLRRVWGPEHMVAAVTLPGDRRDDLLAEAARAIADGFDRVVVYEDADRRGRAAGEVPALVRREIAAYRPEVRCGVVRRVEEAVPAALAMAAPGDVVLVMYDRIDPVLALLGGLGAVPVEDPSPARRGDGSEPAPRFTPAAGSLRGV